MDSKITVGPFGGAGGGSWDDGVFTGIRQIVIVYGCTIDSIHVEYDKNGQSMWGTKHGGSGGANTAKVVQDFPNEYLISVSGSYNKYTNLVVINSLTFQSNKRTFGPFRDEKGNHFSFPTSDGGKIVGFHGRSGIFLDAIGAHVGPITNPNPIESVGPFGGQGGNQWDDGTHTTIRQIVLQSGLIIDSIRTEYDKDGSSVWSPKHGGSGGGNSHTVKFDYPNEFLISLSGYHGTYEGKNIVQSLTFQTNRKTYGPFGPEGGNSFSIPSTGGKITGFHGSSGLYLDSIGAHIERIPIYHHESVGPFGGQGGNSWDDEVYTAVRQIIIATGDLVDSISIEYDKNGQSIWSLKHGESNGGEKHTVKLDHPNEFITLITGYYGTSADMIVVQSLTFQTNRKTYGPFGAQKGNQFSIPSNGGKIVGFHGRSGAFLDSIGAHIETISYP